MLPITLQMQIDLSAAAHKREIAEGFAKLRRELAPTPQEVTAQDLFRAVFQDVDWRHQMALQQQAANYPLGHLHPLQAANAAWNGRSTGGGWLGFGSPWF